MAAGFEHTLDEAVEAAERWALFDPDPVTRGRLDELVGRRDPELVELFDGRLAFGTAGLRAEVGPGPKRMNALVVRQTTAAVMAHLRASGPRPPRVVIGFDARADSATFAGHAAAAVAAAGGTALLADRAAPTPVFAHALVDVGADAAIVITASHNPAPDNGYKLYLGDGLQLVPPDDEVIAERIDAMAGRWYEHGTDIDDTFAERSAEDVTGGEAGLVDAWEARHRAAAQAALHGEARDLTIAYTAMHGVGGAATLAALNAAGFGEPAVVAEQFEPDGAFPTTAFPNPEEPGALDLVIELALEAGADAAFAQDPDADRLAVAVPNRDRLDFTTLSGNELGVLLADHVLRHTDGADRVVARSIVSSRLLDDLAAAAGITCDVTLTGFKWVARPIVDRPDNRYVFGYEEALGYCIGDHVRDKDGITAALVAAEMLAELAAAGKTAWDRLDELAASHGLYLNHPLTARIDGDPATAGAVVDRLRNDPPERIGFSEVVRVGPIGWGDLPPTPGVQLLTADATQVIVRPSGTEPKLKAYIEVFEPVSGDLQAARARATRRLDDAATDIRERLRAESGS